MSIAKLDRIGIPMDAPVAPRRHVWRWVTAAAILGCLASILSLFASSDIKWGVIPKYVFSESMLVGLGGTIVLTIAVMALASVLGTLIAIARHSTNPVLSTFGAGFVWLFRGVPALVQLLIWFNLALVIPTLGFGPFEMATNQVMTSFAAALLGLGLSESAYMAEIVRGGILSVPAGQVEAAKSMGMSSAMTMRKVVLPQAIRVIIPPTGNEFIGMLKYTSLAFAVSYSDLLSQASKIYTTNFMVIEALLSATVWYLILCTISSLLQIRIERHFDLGKTRSIRTRPVQARKGKA